MARPFVKSVSSSLIRLPARPDQGLSEIEVELDGERQSLILLREGDAVHAWLNICPHAGRRLDYAPGRFLRDREQRLVCAAHGACFELPSGTCVAGPCRGQSLTPVPVELPPA